MARPATGSLKIEQQVDGTLRFRLRFTAYGRREPLMLHEQRDCDCGCGGGWSERTARVELRNIIARSRPALEAAQAEAAGRKAVCTDADVRRVRLRLAPGKARRSDRREGNRREHARRLPLDAAAPPAAVLRSLPPRRNRQGTLRCVQEAQDRRDARAKEALDAGADLRDERNRKLVPLGAASIRGLLDCLGAILEEAVEDELIPVNYARSKRLKIHVPKPKRTFLEMDELASSKTPQANKTPPSRASPKPRVSTSRIDRRRGRARTLRR